MLMHSLETYPGKREGCRSGLEYRLFAKEKALKERYLNWGRFRSLLCTDISNLQISQEFPHA